MDVFQEETIPMRAMWLLILLIAAFPITTVHAAPDIVYEDPFANFKFTQTLGSFTFQNRLQYDRVDLGYGINYVERTGALATIIVYDLNQRGFANGTADARVLEEFSKIDSSIAAFAQQGGYRAATRIEAPQLSKAWLQANHELVRPDGRKAHAYSFMRAQNGKFVKIRVTAPSAGTFERLPVFLLGVSRAIGMLNASEASKPAG